MKYRYVFEENPEEKPAVKRWKFAYTVILNENIRPRLSSFKWENIKETIDRSKEYHKIYSDQLNHTLIKQHHHRAKVRISSSTFFSWKLSCLLFFSKELEKQLDAFNLTYIRRIAQIEVRERCFN